MKALPWFQSRSRGVEDREHPPEINTFGGIAQTRPQLGVYPQEAPEQPRQGDTPSRPPAWPIAILTGMDPWKVAEGRFVAVIVSPHPHASYPYTRMTPSRLRSNIPVPPHVAYGSMFTAAPPRY